MTASALTRPGERERLSVKLGQIDWRLVILVTMASCMFMTPWALSQCQSRPPHGQAPWQT
jgi:hypothetical protein